MKKPKKDIRTTGQLREILADAIKDVIEGNIETDDANAIHKLSKNITDSLYSETKMRMFEKDIGKEAPKMGDMPLGGSEESDAETGK